MEIINGSLNYELFNEEGFCFIRVDCIKRSGPEDPSVPAEQ